jgi:serine protease
MDPENDRLRSERQRDPQRDPQMPEPRIQRLGPRDEPEAAPPPPQPAPQPPRPVAPKPLPPEPVVSRPAKPLGRWRRLAAILLLVVAGGVLIGGSDEKASPPPEPPSVAASAETVPNEIVVDLRDNATDAEILGLGQSLGIELRYNSIHAVAAKLMVATVNPADRERVLATLAANPLVEAAEPQFIYRAHQAPAPAANRFVPNDPEYPRQWHLKMIGMEEAWAKTKGKGAIVAVIDTGVGGMSANGWIQGQDFAQTQFVKGYDFANNRDAAPDDEGHGTHVSGTIAESTDNGILGAGVAPEAQIMPLRVEDAKGGMRDSSVADALHYAADHNANVVNMSLGGPAPSQILEKAVQYAYKKNVMLICSAGNEGKEGVGYPGKFKECLAVSAVGPGGLMAAYSTWGKEVDIAAPGGDPKQGEAAMVWQNTFMQRKGLFGPYGPRVDTFHPMVGTSMAAPHVTGVAALLVSLGMTDPKEIRSQLRKSAKKYAPADHYGAGILDAAKAVESVQRSTRTNNLQLWLAVGAAALLLTIGRNLQRKTDPMFFVHQISIALAVGLFFPVVLERLVGFGSWWNLAGHSVIVAIVFLMTPRLDRSGFWKAFAFTVGIVIHLLLDADSSRVPFQVYPQQRILFWMYANVAVGLYFAASAYRSIRQRATAEAT